MGNLIFKPASGGVLKLQDAGSTDRITVTDGGTTVLNEDGGAASLTVETNGDVTVNTGNLVIGASSQGIDFSNQASPAAGMTSELLDSYEEGTWTGVVTDGTNAMSMTANTTGYYTRIGNIVMVTGYFQTDSLGSPAADGPIKITGLPFACNINTAAYSGVSMGYANGFTLSSAGQSVNGNVERGQTYINFRVWDLTSGVSQMLATEWTLDGTIQLSAFYRTD